MSGDRLLEETAKIACWDYRQEYERWWQFEDAIEFVGGIANPDAVERCRETQREFTAAQKQRQEILDDYWLKTLSESEES